MKRLSLGFGLLLVVSAVACDSDESGDACEGGAPTCAVPWDCDPGYTCEEGCCVEFGCTPDSCGAGEFCDVDFTCKTIEEKCTFAAQGCECHILNSAGEFEASEAPQITTVPGATVGLQAVLAEKGGNPLPGAVFSWGINEGSDGNQFSLDGANLTALDAAAGSATVTASAGSIASCTVTAKNLGPAPADNNIRFFVYDDRTGVPIVNSRPDVWVEIVVDTAGDDGVDDGWPVGERGTTDVDGVAITTELASFGSNQPYDVTVFATGYNYLTVTGLTIEAAGKDIALPLAARPARKADKLVGGFTGKMSFADYERIVLGGSQKTIKVGIVSSSFPLNALLNFDLDLLLGDMPSSGTCDADPTAAGCYNVGLPPLVEEQVRPLPGGLVLNFAGNWLKEHFDVVATPGRRYAWALGGEVEIPDVAGVAGLLFCGCNETPDVCDADCPCDRDCGIDFGGLFDTLIPLFSAFGSGVQGNLGLKAEPLGVWNAYLETAYEDGRLDPDHNFPKLDSDGLGKLRLREPLQTFTEFEVPDLPQDPDEEPGVAMEGMIVLSGIDATGYGFVPLGLGVGLDCTEGDCLDRTENPDGFDGTVNGGLMCIFDPDPKINRCPPDVPISELQDGHLGMFRARPHGGLEGQQPLTVAVALPISSLTSGANSDIRATGLVLRDTPATGISTQIKDKTYAAFPTQPDNTNGRAYAVEPTPGIDVHWVTLASPEVDGMTTRWNIFFDNPAATKAFHAPAVPAGFVDPADAALDGVDIPLNHINATHVALRLTSSATVADLARNNGSTLADLASEADGFSVQSRDICAVDGGCGP